MALPLAACSSGSGDEGDRSSPTTATGADGTAAVDTTFSGQGSEEFCQQIRTYAEGARRLGQSATPDVRAIYSEAARAVNESVATAPSEIRREVQLVAEAFNALVRELEAVNYEFPRLSQAVVARFMSEELSNATTRVEAYARSVCGVSG